MEGAFKEEKQYYKQSFEEIEKTAWPKLPEQPEELDLLAAELAEKYKPLADEILKEVVRIPEDYVAEDPLCGTSNHEKPRMEYLRRVIIEKGAVAKPEDVDFDEFGNIVWVVQDESDGIPVKDKSIIYFDGHCDTVFPLPQEWKKLGDGIDVYKGLTNQNQVDEEKLKRGLGYLPDKSEWESLIFGRGSADQLSGVVQQIVATKIMLELKEKGSLKGVMVRAYGTVSEEDNDGGGPMFVTNKVLPQHPEWIPDVVIHTEGTGDTTLGPCGIYIGQRGRVQVQVDVVGKSSHGSMPWEGKNPVEYGALIIVQARQQYDSQEGFHVSPHLGGGTRTASWAETHTPSYCAVPASFSFRFDRRLTEGEDPLDAVKKIESLPAVAEARDRGLSVKVHIPHYVKPTWRGYTPGNAESYLSWATPPGHKAIQVAYDSWQRTVGQCLLSKQEASLGSSHPLTKLPKEPRVGYWIFSTDGVGYPVRKDDPSFPEVPARKQWIETPSHKHPAQLGMGIGFENNTHKIGEFIDSRHFPAAIAFLARYPSLFAKAN